MLPTFRTLPSGSASVPPSPTGHAGVAAVLAAVMAAAMALAAVTAVSVGGQASVARHDRRALPPLAQGPVSAALGRADRGYRLVGLRTRAGSRGRKKLKPGRYSVGIAATNAAGQRTVGKTLRFRIVRG